MRGKRDEPGFTALPLPTLRTFSSPTGRERAAVDLDRWLAEIAARQHGVVAWWQLAAVGVPRGRVDRLLDRRRLVRVHRGVYAVGHRALTLQGRRLAAVLALGPKALLSHRSAAEHRALLPIGGGAVIHVTLCADGRRRRRKGFRIHHAPDAMWSVHAGIPTTTVAWTLLDLAATERAAVVGQAIEGAVRQRVFDLAELRPLLATPRPGVRALRDALRLYDDAPTESELEVMFLSLCRDHDLPRPRVNELVEGYRADFHWPEHRLIVETDGGIHDEPAARRRDGERDAVHALAGWRTQRISWWQVAQEPVATAALIRRLLADQAAALRTFSSPAGRERAVG